MTSKINLLWRHADRPLYLMDNHRAAFWCWHQHIDAADEYTLLHVDFHWDAVEADDRDRLRRVAEQWRDFETFDKTLAKRWAAGLPDIALVRWDNYIDSFLTICPRMRDACMAVHQSEATIAPSLRPFVSEAPSLEGFFHDIDSFFETARAPAIVNIDIDYFFMQLGWDQKPMRAFDLNFVRAFFSRLSAHWDKTRVMTIALSPECCGGWAPAEEACRAAFEGLGIAYPLPAEGSRVDV